MSKVYSQVGYGFSQPLPTLATPPVVSPATPAQGIGRAPTVNDKYPIGTLWVWAAPAAQEVFIEVGIVNNQAIWVVLAGGVLNPLAINLPNTNAAATVGFISFNNVIYLTNSGGDSNVFLGALSGNPGGGVTGTNDTALGSSALASLTTGTGNTALGSNTLADLATGLNNTAVGFNSGAADTTGASNVFIGRSAGAANTTGSFNVYIGDSAGDTVVAGSNNTIIGQVSGSSYVGAESSNIIIDNSGSTLENNTIRIGTPGSAAGEQNRCFIAGIRGITTGNADAVAVLVDSASQLGTVSSSARYKDNIQDMGDSSSAIMNLRPVTFTYKSDTTNSMQFGLIAEEAVDVLPRLVVKDAEGRPETIKYHDLPALLLNEIQKLRKDVNDLKGSK